MKIFSSAPEGNEAAEMQNAIYINVALERIEKSNTRLKDINKAHQVMLTHIDILLMISKRFPVNANLLIKKDRAHEWKSTFNTWFDRCSKKIPAEFRDGIRQSADELFAELDTFGH